MIDTIPTEEDLEKLTAAPPWRDKAWADQARKSAEQLVVDTIAQALGEAKDLALTVAERRGLRWCSRSLFHTLRAARYRAAAERTTGRRRERAVRRMHRSERRAAWWGDRCKAAPPYPIDLADGRLVWVRPCEVMQACEVMP